MNFISGRNSQWMKAILMVAGIYNILWGISVVFFPQFWFQFVNLELPNYIPLWQFMGMTSAIFGLGFIMASFNPLRNWVIVLMGLLLKMLGPIGFLYYYLHHEIPGVIINMHITNDIIWWIPFAIILYNAYKHDYLLDNEIIAYTEHNTEELLAWFNSNKGNSLLELSYEQPVMLVFLRHFGCTFCRLTLTDINRYREAIEKQGTKIVLVHQLSEEHGQQELEKYHLQSLEHVSDPELTLFKGFRLRRGTLLQLFGWHEWKSFFRNGLLKGLFIGAPGEQDPFQMPGIFILKDGVPKLF